MSGWEIKWRDGYVEGFETAEDSLDVVEKIDRLFWRERPIEIKVTRR